MFKDKNILVTGGRTGFVGTNISKKLIELGANVYVHSSNYEKTGNFSMGQSTIIADLTKPLQLKNDIDYVFHCAAYTGGAKRAVENSTLMVLGNTFINLNILDASAKARVKKFVFISSSAVYPELSILANEKEGYSGNPTDPYFGLGWMKRYSEKIAEFYHKQYNMDVLIIRPSNIYGPYCSFDANHSHVLPALIRKFVERFDPLEVWGLPDVSRDFIYIDDFVRGTLLAFVEFEGFDIFNIASGNQYTIREVVELISVLTKYKGNVVYNSSKPMTFHKKEIDITKATKQLGFVPRVSLEEGLGRTIEWYKKTLLP